MRWETRQYNLPRWEQPRIYFTQIFTHLKAQLESSLEYTDMTVECWPSELTCNTLSPISLLFVIIHLHIDSPCARHGHGQARACTICINAQTTLTVVFVPALSRIFPVWSCPCFAGCRLHRTGTAHHSARARSALNISPIYSVYIAYPTLDFMILANYSWTTVYSTQGWSFSPSQSLKGGPFLALTLLSLYTLIVPEWAEYLLHEQPCWAPLPLNPLSRVPALS